MRPTKVIDQKSIDELYRLKKEKGLCWGKLYKLYKDNGGVKEYRHSASVFGQAIRYGNVKDLDILIKAVKELPKPDKRQKVKKKAANVNRCGFYTNNDVRRSVKVYAIENGVFGLQREYLE